MTSDTMRNGGAATPAAAGFRASLGLGFGGLARRTLGISMLMVTVFLWTASNFMASYMFNDDDYTKPFFVVYVNTSAFALSLIPMAVRFVWANGAPAARHALYELLRSLHRDVRQQVRRGGRKTASEDDGSGAKLLGGEDDGDDDDDDDDQEDRQILRRRRTESIGGAAEDDAPDDLEAAFIEEAAVAALVAPEVDAPPPPDKLDLRGTAWLSLEFCMLWFLANYFAVACLEHTSVASATIFTSLSGVFTLLFCALARVERFTLRKLVGVLASLAGVVLVSTVDLTGPGTGSGSVPGAPAAPRDDLPLKPASEIALGDAMALLSAVIYGAYVTVMKQRVGNEDRVNMSLFFGLVGLFNVVLLWPGLVLLHATGVERFELPPSRRVWAIIILNSLASFLSDLTWAYAMLLTTPLVVTVGLSLTIPLSIVGEMVQFDHYANATYWLGACVVVVSFLFINNESHETTEEVPLVERNE